MKKEIILGVAVLMLAACGGSSEDVDAVAASMMTGSDARPEKEARCMAKALKKVAGNDQWDMMVKRATGEIDESDMTMEQAMGLLAPMTAASVECGVKLFE